MGKSLPGGKCARTCGNTGCREVLDEAGKAAESRCGKSGRKYIENPSRMRYTCSQMLNLFPAQEEAESVF